MKKDKAKNEIIKRKYFRWLKDAEGYAKATIEAIETALWDYEDYSSNEDFAKFNNKKANEFKKWLALKKTSQGTISLTTQYTRLRHLRKFFTWLSGQNGYKSKVSVFDATYLKLDKKKSKEATTPKVLEYPSLEYVIKLCSSIEIKNEIDMRDRALIAFTLISGMRDDAIVSLPMESFKESTLTVLQDPKLNVRTKFSKQIITTLFNFEDSLMQYFLEWYNYLKKDKLFKNTDPIFPRSEVKQISKQNHTYIATNIEPKFWKTASAMRKIFKDRELHAELEYYSPHKFRHSAIRLATDQCRGAEQIKAVSQNLGHEHVSTTLSTYGRLAPDRIKDIINSMIFKASDNAETVEKLKRLVATLE